MRPSILAGILGGLGAWLPSSLGSNLGAWYEPNDLTTLFTDTGGSTPATVNTQVARMNDKSAGGYNVTQATAGLRPYLRGTPTGANLVTDGEFFTGTGWTFNVGWSKSTPASVGTTAATTLDFALPAVIGKSYLVKFTVQSRTAGSVELTFGGVSLGVVSTAVSRSKVITAVSTAGLSISGAMFSGAIRAVGVKDVSSGFVAAPYYLEFDGVDDQMIGSAMVQAYPATLMARTMVDGSALGALGIFSLWQGSADNKHLRVLSGSLDWKEAASGTSITGETDIACTMRAGFVSGTNNAQQALNTAVNLAHANTFGAKTSIYVGSGRSFDSYFAGRFYGGFVGTSDLTSGERVSANLYYGTPLGVEAWGDSLTAGLQVGTNVLGGYVTRLRNVIERHCGNNGGSGETSTQITTRFVAASADSKRLTHVFWMGTNNANAPATVKADIATCISGLNGHSRYIVSAPFRSSGNGLAASAYATLESDLLTIYGSKFLDLRAIMNTYSDGSANDTADIADGLVPRSLRLDGIHHNDKGNQIITEAIAAKIAALGYPT